MAFVRLAFFPNGTHDHYRALQRAMQDTPSPAGRFAFTTGPVPGGWQVVQIWRSRAELDAFNTSHLLPALAQVGAAGFPEPPHIVDFEPVDLEIAEPAT